ncbi:hypothetical protein BKA66DRAFT_472391 [Pyrenochaeta sp. MPI-SDFR-AT-0127]|nr:hypothetical protein BKA66DRAFT_472391 [Pyrenochaeta sp. MPI-SDFR-AT-0127]
MDSQIGSYIVMLIELISNIPTPAFKSLGYMQDVVGYSKQSISQSGLDMNESLVIGFISWL